MVLTIMELLHKLYFRVCTLSISQMCVNVFKTFSCDSLVRIILTHWCRATHGRPSCLYRQLSEVSECIPLCSKRLNVSMLPHTPPSAAVCDNALILSFLPLLQIQCTLNNKRGMWIKSPTLTVWISIGKLVHFVFKAEFCVSKTFTVKCWSSFVKQVWTFSLLVKLKTETILNSVLPLSTTALVGCWNDNCLLTSC